MMLVSLTPSGPRMGRTSFLDLIGDTPINGEGGGECIHKHAMEHDKCNESQYRHNMVD